MAATVTVRAKAFGDSRIVYLGQLLGCSWNDAFVRVVRLWSVCAEKQSDKPEVRHIRACLEHPQGEVHLVESGLGDDKHRDPTLDDGVIRVRGCDEADWYLARLEQEARVEAGRIRASLAERDTNGKYRAGAPPPRSVQQDSSTTPASRASDHSPDLICSDLPDQAPTSFQLPDLGAIVGEERERAIAAVTPKAVAPQRSRTELRRKLFTDSWAYAGLRHEELRHAGVDQSARNCWGGLPNASSVEVQALFARIDELAAGDDLPAEFARAGDAIRNRVDVAAAEARRDQTLRWFIPARMWDAKSFAIAKDLSPEQAAQPRGPRPPSSRPDRDPPPRKMPTAR